MYIWNKVLLGLNIVMALVFCFFAMRALQTHRHWRDSIQKLDQAIVQNAQQKHDLINGTEAKPGLRQMQVEVNKFTVGRGRNWPHSMLQHINPGSGELVVSTTIAPPHSTAAGMQLYVFADAMAGTPGAYLGEYSINSITAQGWLLKPSRPLTPERQAVLQRSQGRTVTMYEVMPSPRPFAVEQTAEASPSDKPVPAEEYAAQFISQLADYETIFTQHYDAQMLLRDQLASLKADLEATQTATAKVQERSASLTTSIAAAKTELEKVEASLKAVVAHHDAVQTKLTELQKTLGDTLKDNQSKAAQIAQIQEKATREIDQKTRDMVAVGAGR